MEHKCLGTEWQLCWVFFVEVLHIFPCIRELKLLQLKPRADLASIHSPVPRRAQSHIISPSVTTTLLCSDLFWPSLPNRPSCLGTQPLSYTSVPHIGHDPGWNTSCIWLKMPCAHFGVMLIEEISGNRVFLWTGAWR